MDTIFTRFMWKIKLLVVVLIFVGSYQIYAQCETPVVGCPGTDFTNFGLNSNNDAATIEYDNFSSTFHSTTVRTADGSFQVWGEDLQNGGGNLLSPITINSTNFPGLTGTVLKVGIAGIYVNQVQGVVLTTNGLFVWGIQGNVVSSSLTSSVSLQPITVGGNTQGLPVGITPADVKMMFVTAQTISITTCVGDVYVLAQNANVNQGGSATAWERIRTNEPGEPFLTNVIVARGANAAMFALRADGTLWTWGQNTYLGDNTAPANRNRATLMESPVASGVDVKMIGATFTGTFPNGSPSYYVLDTNGNLYALGLNTRRQLGDFTTTERRGWIQPRYTSAAGPVMDNIAWMSPVEHDWRYGAINVITNTGDLYAWGDNDGRMLGRGAATSVDPGVPDGPLTDDILAVETGGHTTMIAMRCTENFGYVGHRIRGSMGNGSNTTSTENQFTFATASVQICGAETIPAVFTVTVNSNSDGTICVDGEVRLVPDVAGGTFTLLSGPAVLTPDGDDAILTFTGTGIVDIDYEVVGDCGSVTVEVALEVVDCVADLEVIKAVNNSTPDVGDTIVFTIQAINNGPQRAANVELTDLLPSGYSYVSHTATTGAYNYITGLWNGFNIIDGESETLQITVTVNGSGDYVNTATITSDTPDPDSGNNEDTSTITLPNLPPVATTDEAFTDIDIPITFSIVTNDTDSDGTIDTTTVDLDPLTPGQQTSFTVPGEGTYTVDTNGNVTFTPVTGFTGISSITYTVIDNDGLISNVANIIVQVGYICAEDVDGDNFALADGEDVIFNQPATNYGFQFDVYTLDNSFNLNINGIDLASQELEFQSSGTSGINVRFVDGDEYETNTLPIWQMTGNAAAPLIRVVISPSGTISMFGSKTNGGALFALELFNGNTFNTIPWNSAAPNTIIGSQSVVGTTYMTGYGSGKNITPCNPELTLLKSGVYNDTNSDAAVTVGDEIVYTFTVENTGNVVITNVTVDDAAIGVTGLAVTPSNLEPGEVGVATFNYSITQEDINSGGVYNIALATGQDPNGGDVQDESEDPVPLDPSDPNYDPSCPDCTFTELLQNPEITILKDGSYVDSNGDGVTNIGDTITYTFTVENTGNVTLTDITVTDANAVVSGGPLASLAVGATDTTTFTAVHTITQDDIDAGFVYNLATVTGEAPDGDPVTDGSEDPTPCTTCPVDPACTDCTIVELESTPSIVITKDGSYVDSNGDGVTNIGDTITYTFTVENTGNVTLTDITVTDANAVVSGGPLASLAVGATDTTTFTAVHTITQDDIDAGFVYNLATVTGEAPDGDPVTDESEDPTPCTTCPVDPACTDCTIVELESTPSIVITKDGSYVDSNGDGVTNIGDTITYTFTVENTGNVTLTDITVTDANAVVSGGPLASLAVGATDTTTFTAVHTITQDDIDAGFVYNLATVTGEAPDGDPVTDGSEDPTPCTTCPVDPACTDCTIVELESTPSIVITKDGSYVDSNGDGVTNVGDTITYTFTVENTGNVTLTDITVTDANAVVSGGPLASLAVGATDTTTFTAVHTITQDDIDAGYVYNLATATGEDPDGDPVTDESEDPTPCTTCPVDPACTDCTIVELESTPSIVITKDGSYVDSNGDGVTNIGDTITYTFTVENTGNVTLTDITVTDANAVVSGGPLASLAVGATDTTTFTAVHTITQDDIDAGFVYNLATVTGEAPDGDPVTDGSEDPTPCTTCPVDPACTDCTIVELESTPSIVITKDGSYVDSNGDGVTNVGDTITYTFTVENTGNVTLTDITVTDANAVVSGGPLASLAVGATDTTTFTAVHTITQDDIDAGYVYNLATATGEDPDGDPVTDESEDPTPCTTCPVDPACTDCTIVELESTPSIVITKDGSYVDSNGDGVTNIGDTITYTFTVENTGNVTLTDITVTDNNAVVTGGPLASLAVGATDTTTFTAVHTITQDDIDAGFVYNLATVTGEAPDGDPVTDGSEDPTPCTTCPVDPACTDCTIVELESTPSIVITKDGSYVDSNGDGVTNIGDTITYTFTVENTGNVTLTDITVTDANAVVSGGPLASLAVGATDTTTFTAVHTITQDDIDAGFVYNLATATGEDPDGDPVTDGSEDPTPCTTCPVDPACTDCTIVELESTPSIVITKDGSYVDSNGDGVTNIGDTITYTFTVENTGNVTLTDITVTDANAVVSGGPLASLAVGATDTTTFTAVHTITQDDIDAGYVYNLATATGEDPDGDPVTDESEDPTPCTSCPVDPGCTDCTITELDKDPSISITKDGTYVDTNGDGVTNIGDEITYVFTVENTGNVTLTNITVTDNNAVVTGGPLATLAVGATDTTTFTAVHTITQDDIDAGFVYNLATVTGEAPDGDPVTDGSEDPTPCTTCPVDPACTDCTIVELESTPSIMITKDGSYVDSNGDGVTNIGDTITYTFTVENTGNVVLTNITVTDANAVVSGGPLASLAVGATDTTTFTAVHTLTQDDIDAGFVYNLASVTGDTPDGNTVTGESVDPTPCEICPVDPECTDCTIVELEGDLACEIEVYNAVSADGDGINDMFLLEGIDCYPNNRVIIFNRWGVKVFETEGYDNVNRVFRGYSDGRITISRGDQLPTGTYFYILEYTYTGGNNPINKSGYLYLTTGN